MMFNQRTSGFVGTPTVSKSAPRTTMRTTFTIESGLSTADRNQKRSRIGKQPIAVPKGVTYDLKEGSLKVKVRFLNSFKARFGEINLRIRAERRLFRASKTSNFARGFPLSQRRRGGISQLSPSLPGSLFFPSRSIDDKTRETNDSKLTINILFSLSLYAL